MNYKQPVSKIKELIQEKLDRSFGVSLENATDDQCYKAVALTVREMMVQGRSEYMADAEKTHTKQIYYLCMEFLLGRSLKNNLFNLGIEDDYREALSQMGVQPDEIAALLESLRRNEYELIREITKD